MSAPSKPLASTDPTVAGADFSRSLARGSPAARIVRASGCSLCALPLSAEADRHYLTGRELRRTGGSTRTAEAHSTGHPVAPCWLLGQRFLRPSSLDAGTKARADRPRPNEVKWRRRTRNDCEHVDRRRGRPGDRHSHLDRAVTRRGGDRGRCRHPSGRRHRRRRRRRQGGLVRRAGRRAGGGLRHRGGRHDRLEPPPRPSCWAAWGRANACCWVPSRPSCRRQR